MPQKNGKDIAERLEDLVLGHEAKRRASQRGRKTVSLEEAVWRIRLLRRKPTKFKLTDRTLARLKKAGRL